MKRMIRASHSISSTQEMFTLDDFVCLLHWIKELQGKEISLSKISNGDTCLLVGDYAYSLDALSPQLDLDE